MNPSNKTSGNSSGGGAHPHDLGYTGNINNFCYALKQQSLKAWQPVPTINSTLLVFALLTAFFGAMGGALLWSTITVVEITVPYDAVCTLNSLCNITFRPTAVMNKPVFFYYELSNYYQNHRIYMQSRDNEQLSGSSRSYDDVSTSCDPIVTMGDLGRSTSVDGTFLSNSTVASPCGLVARSYFTDNFTLLNQNRSQIVIEQNNIAWPSDRDVKYNRQSNWQKTQWVDVEDEHFMVWMRAAALPKFRKLWGRIEQDLLPTQTYTIQINNTYDVSRFYGTKAIVLSTATGLGGKNWCLTICYLVVAGVCFLLFMILLVKKFITPNKFEQIEEKLRTSL